MGDLLKVDTSNLVVGMYISQLDRPWLETPFLVQGFYVKNRKDIDIISDICDYVYVDSSVSSKNITANMSTVSSAMGMTPASAKTNTSNSTSTDNAESTLREIAAITGKSRPNNKTSPTSKGDGLFPDRKLKTYTDTSSWEEEKSSAIKAVSSLHECLNDILSRNEKGGSLEIARIKQAVEPMVDSVTRNPDACIWLARMKEEDNYIYQHSLGAAIWAVALGRQLGLPKSDLRSLAIGGLLLDIGKLKLKKEILKANRHLTSKETKIMRRHVEVSVLLLKDGGMDNQDVIGMVAHHHERHNGTGYPQGLAGDDIPVFARIAAIVDCFDAITSDRIYAKAISPSQAIKQLYTWKDIYFQGELIEEFIQAVGVYPAGTLVELTSGEVAVVVGESRSRRLRPQVMLLLDSNKQPLDDINFLNLQEVTHTEDGQQLNIINSLKPNAYGIDMSAIEL